MAQQLVYTSAPKLLDAGRSGFGTVARSKSLSPLLVSAIERVSQFANIRGTERSRVIFVHRRIVAANHRIHLLSRIADAGADYTGRTNHIAHHLIVPQEEMTRLAARGITPADVLQQFQWLTRWDGAPKFFGPEEDLPLERTIHPLGRQSARSSWTRLTGNLSHARLLAWDGAPRNGVLLVPRGSDPLGLLAEALAEFGPQSWSRTFTTNLETTDEMSDFDWVVSSPENFREIESRCGTRARLDLGKPQSLPVPPEPVTPKQETEPSRMAGAYDHQTWQATSSGTESVVKVRVVNKASAEAPSCVPVSTVPAKSRRPIAIIIAAAAAVVLVGIIVLKTVSGSKGPESQANVKATEQDVDQARRILEEVRVSPEKAKEFANNCGDNPKEWANYASALLSKFQSPPLLKELRSGLGVKPAGKIPTGWLTKLDEAKSALEEFDLVDDKGKVQEKMEKLSKIHYSLIGVAEGLGDAPLSKGSADRFCEPLALRELENLFGSEDWVSYSEEKINSIGSTLRGHFKTKEKPYAYEALCKFIRSKFNQFASSPTNTIFENAGATIDENDANNLKEALACWKDPNKSVGDELKKSAGKGFVPEDFEGLLNEHRSKNQARKPTEIVVLSQPDARPEKGKKAGPNLSGVPEKEIIIVARKQLEEGVEVALLKAWMSINPCVEDLTGNLKIDGQEIKTLVAVDKQEYFSENWDDKKNAANRKIHKSGKFSLAKSNVMDVSLSTVSGGKSCEAWIVIDEPSNSSRFDKKLTFGVEKLDGNNGRVTGQLAEHLKGIRLESGAILEVAVDPNMPDPNAAFDRDRNIILAFRDAQKPEFVIDDRYRKRIEERLKTYEGAYDRPAASRELKAEKEAKLNQLIEDIIIAFAEPSLAKEIGLPDGIIKNSDYEIARDKVKAITKVSCGIEPHPKMEDFILDDDRKKKGKLTEEEEKKYNQAIAEVDKKNLMLILEPYEKEKIKIDEVLKKYAKAENGISSLKSANLDKIKGHIKHLLKNTEPPALPSSFENKVFGLKKITVKTSRGRTLFTASMSK